MTTKKSKKPFFSPGQFNIAYFAIALAIAFGFQAWFTSMNIAQLPYSEFQQLLKDKKIKSAAVKDDTIRGELKEPRDGKTRYVTDRVDPSFAKELEQHDVEFTGVPENTWLSSLLSLLLPILLFLGIWMLLVRKMADKQGLGGMMNVGKSKAKVYVEKSTGVDFSDVAGVEHAKAELSEIVSFLKDKEKFSRLGARSPKGILLVGPPGTGKTLLAKAVAGEADVPFFSISGSEFVEMFVGVGAARVRDLFEQARKVAPCIIFIDELDSLGKRRSSGGGVSGGNDEKEQTLNQLLAEMDGFDPTDGIVLLGATNRPEVIDPALKRAGRFDREVVVDRPDRNGREAILKIHLRKVSFDPDLDIEKIAAITPGFSGADLANLANEAAIVATRRDGMHVKMEDFTQAVERLIAGNEQRGKLMNKADRERVAWHEMGHAMAAASLPSTDPVHKVSIIPRTIGALGYTLTRPTEDRFLITTEELKDKMVVLLAGRAAEELTFGSISTGASDDLNKTTDIARQMVTTFGMDPSIGQTVHQKQSGGYLGNAMGMPAQREYSEETAREIDIAVRDLIAQAYDRAREILELRRDDLEAVATMKISLPLILSITLSACAQSQPHGSHESKYVGQEKREIKSLSANDIEELRRGGGWGLAKAAELNGLPGPAHILELQSELKLEQAQITRVQELHSIMKQRAIVGGEKLIALEKALEIRFRERSVDEEQLKKALADIAGARAELRYVHLSAHLATPLILTEKQIAQYNELRGYNSTDPCAAVPNGHNAAMWRRHNGCE